MRLIDADALKNIVPKCDMDMHVMDFKGLIDKTPTIDVAPVKRGEWERIPDDWEHFYVGACSNCGCEPSKTSFREKPYYYCPNCGAKMDMEV